MTVRPLAATALLLALMVPHAASAAAACKIGTLLVLPVTMRGSAPVVPATINGIDTQFIVDSGAFFSVISTVGAAKLNLRTEMAPPGFMLNGVGGAARAMVTTAKELTLAGGTSSNVQFVVGGNDHGDGIAGLFGQNILGYADVEYDFGGGALRLIRAVGCDDGDRLYWGRNGQPYSVMSIEKATPTAPHIIGTALLNGKKIKVMFDTGAAISVLSQRAAERAGVKMDAEGVVKAGRMRGIGSKLLQTWLAPFDSIKIGDEEILNTKLRIADIDLPNADMLLGADFFLSHRVYVAKDVRKVLFTHNGGPVFNLNVTQYAADADDDGVMREPTDAAGFSSRGALFAARRDLPRAIQDLTRAVELQPTEAEYVYQRGRLYLDNQQPRLALSDFDQALKLKSDHVPARMARAGLHLSRFEATGAGVPSDITADLDLAGGALEKNSDYRLELSSLYARAGDFPQAIAEVDLWLDQHRGDSRAADAFASRCRARALMGHELDKALDDCNRAVRDRPGIPFVFDSRGIVHLRLRNFDKAIADYDTVLRVQPRNPWALYGRGLAKLGKGQATAGEADIAQARAANPRVVAEAAKHGLVP